MSNAGFSYWNGQPMNAPPMNAPVYPQMGDLMQSQTGGGAAPSAGGFAASGWPGQTASTTAQAPSVASAPGPYASPSGSGLGLGQGLGQAQGSSMAMNPGAQMGMGDYGNVSSPLTCNVPTNFFGQGQGQFEPCIDNGEAFCAYNGMDMSMNYGGGQAKGGFW